jgi:type II secretion system protein J
MKLLRNSSPLENPGGGRLACPRGWASRPPENSSEVGLASSLVTPGKLPGSTAGLRPATTHGTLAFTLIEILIALGIFSLVLAAIYSTWTAILRASKVGRDAAAAVQRARMAGRTIEESFGSVQAFAAHQRFHPEYYAFLSQNGSEAFLSFASRLSPSFPRSGKFAGLDLRRVTFSLEQRSGVRQLVLRQQPLLMDMDIDEKEHPLVLAKFVKEFKTEFWDARLQDWVDEWKSTNQLPVMVKVSLKLADNEFSTQVRQQVTRIVSLPSVGVAPIWQTPVGGPGAPGAPGAPGLPGVPGQGVPGGLAPPGGIQQPPGTPPILNPGQNPR